MAVPAKPAKWRRRPPVLLPFLLLLLLPSAVPARAAEPDAPDVAQLISRGERSLRGRDLIGAMRAFRAAVRAEPDSWRALDGLARTFRASGDLESAERELRRAVQAAPAETVPARNLADLLLAVPDSGRRRDGLRWLGEHATGSSEVQLLVARRARRLGDLDTASASLERARAMVPESKEVMLEEIFLYRDALDYPRAIEVAHEFLRVDPSFHLVHLQLGRIYQLQGKRDDAARHYRRALDLTPGDPTALTRLGELRIADGDLDEARSLLDRAVQVDPDRYQAHYLLGRVYLLQGDDEAAQREMETFRRLKDAQRAAARLAGGAAMVDE